MGKPRADTTAPNASGIDGTVVAVFGRRFEVEASTGERFDCVARARKREAACGDRVTLSPTGPGMAVIDAVLPRTSYLERADRVRRKAIAANADQVLVLVAVEPWFSDEFVTRVLLLADAAGLKTLVALNKTDLPGAAAARERLRVFERAGHEVVEIAARPRDATGARTGSPQGVDALRERLQDRATVLAGQSGMGKSSLVNAMVPEANAATGEISQALGAGRHTTTFSRLYRLDPRSTLIDCPGMQEVGIAHLAPDQLIAGFHDFAPYLNGCRFANCRHDREPGCSLTHAVATGLVDSRRYELFSKLRSELAVPSW